MQINSLGKLLKDFRVVEHKPALPSPARTAKPEKSVVVSNPVRVPVNRQAAMLLRPIREWTSQPLPPEKLPDKNAIEIARLVADLKVERNNHALTRDALGEARLQLRKCRLLNESLQSRVESLLRDCAEKDRIIQQLEDIKL